MAPLVRSTPTKGLEAILGVPPLKLVLEEHSLRTIFRIQHHVFPDWDGRVKNRRPGHFHYWKKQLGKIIPENTITDSIPATPNWNPPYSVIIDDVKEARAENPLLHWNHQDIIVYTDGSKHKDGQTGLGYTIEFKKKYHRPRKAIKLCKKLPDTSTVFQAEVAAALEATCRLKGVKNKKILIRIDSQACLKALQAKTITSSLVMKCNNSLRALCQNNETVTLKWIKAHVGHQGNETADQLANQGAVNGPPLDLPKPPCWVKAKIKEHILNKWDHHWKMEPTCRQTKIFCPSILEPPISKKQLKSLTRTCLKQLLRLFTGHNVLRRHRNEIMYPGEGEPISCRWCEDPDSKESSEHVMFQCDAHHANRTQIFEQLPPLDPPCSPGKILSFLKRTGIGSCL